MIVAVVRFRLDPPLPPEELAESFAASAPRYQGVAGLRRKHFLTAADGTSAGGVYLWDSRDAAEAMYTDEWAARIEAKYGARPEVEYFESPVSVDAETITLG